MALCVVPPLLKLLVSTVTSMCLYNKREDKSDKNLGTSSNKCTTLLTDIVLEILHET